MTTGVWNGPCCLLCTLIAITQVKHQVLKKHLGVLKWMALILPHQSHKFQGWSKKQSGNKRLMCHSIVKTKKDKPLSILHIRATKRKTKN